MCIKAKAETEKRKNKKQKTKSFSEITFPFFSCNKVFEKQ